MEYQVPQFIEVESKIVGPFTLKQFIYIAGGGGLCVALFAYLPLILAILFSLPIAILAAMLAFYKVNGKPFIEVLEAGFAYYTGAKFFLWRHKEPKKQSDAERLEAAHDMSLIRSGKQAAETAARAARGTPKLTQGKLSELAWSLDISTGGGPASDGQPT